MDEPDARHTELAASLDALEQRVQAACDQAGRDRAEVSLIAVTKTYPASDVRWLAALGVTQVGENRDQEAALKHAACADLSLRWHFVGHLQRNKCKSVASYADVVHSVDRTELADALARAALANGREVTALVQVSLDPPSARTGSRSGAMPDDVRAISDHIAGLAGLVLGGVMAVAPLEQDPEAAFAVLEAVAGELRAAHPHASIVSAGMSGDLEAAIRHGATHLRVGTALLGHRSTLVR